MDGMSSISENKNWIYVGIAILVVIVLIVLFWPRSKTDSNTQPSQPVQPTKTYDYDTRRVEVGPDKPLEPNYRFDKVSEAPYPQREEPLKPTGYGRARPPRESSGEPSRPPRESRPPRPPRVSQPIPSSVDLPTFQGSGDVKGSKGELACRKALEEIYGKPFASDWPSWLINPKTRAGMELDCYNEELKIACEYHGRQHYEFVEFFHKTRENFKAMQERDRIKFDILQQRGIYLITVPYTVKVEDIKEYIIYYLPHNRAARLESGLTN